LKNKCMRKFRDQTSSEALSTITCASCAESVSLHLFFDSRGPAN
jgi:hypothetical protein